MSFRNVVCASSFDGSLYAVYVPTSITWSGAGGGEGGEGIDEEARAVTGSGSGGSSGSNQVRISVRIYDVSDGRSKAATGVAATLAAAGCLKQTLSASLDRSEIGTDTTRIIGRLDFSPSGRYVIGTVSSTLSILVWDIRRGVLSRRISVVSSAGKKGRKKKDKKRKREMLEGKDTDEDGHDDTAEAREMKVWSAACGRLAVATPVADGSGDNVDDVGGEQEVVYVLVSERSSSSSSSLSVDEHEHERDHDNDLDSHDNHDHDIDVDNDNDGNDDNDDAYDDHHDHHDDDTKKTNNSSKKQQKKKRKKKDKKDKKEKKRMEKEEKKQEKKKKKKQQLKEEKNKDKDQSLTETTRTRIETRTVTHKLRLLEYSLSTGKLQRKIKCGSESVTEEIQNNTTSNGMDDDLKLALGVAVASNGQTLAVATQCGRPLARHGIDKDGMDKMDKRGKKLKRGGTLRLYDAVTGDCVVKLTLPLSPPPPPSSFLPSDSAFTSPMLVVFSDDSSLVATVVPNLGLAVFGRNQETNSASSSSSSSSSSSWSMQYVLRSDRNNSDDNDYDTNKGWDMNKTRIGSSSNNNNDNNNNNMIGTISCAQLLVRGRCAHPTKVGSKNNKNKTKQNKNSSLEPVALVVVHPLSNSVLNDGGGSGGDDNDDIIINNGAVHLYTLPSNLHDSTVAVKAGDKRKKRNVDNDNDDDDDGDDDNDTSKKRKQKKKRRKSGKGRDDFDDDDDDDDDNDGEKKSSSSSSSLSMPPTMIRPFATIRCANNANTLHPIAVPICASFGPHNPHDDLSVLLLPLLPTSSSSLLSSGTTATKVERLPYRTYPKRALITGEVSILTSQDNDKDGKASRTDNDDDDDDDDKEKGRQDASSRSMGNDNTVVPASAAGGHKTAVGVANIVLGPGEAGSEALGASDRIKGTLDHVSKKGKGGKASGGSGGDNDDDDDDDNDEFRDFALPEENDNDDDGGEDDNNNKREAKRTGNRGAGASIAERLAALSSSANYDDDDDTTSSSSDDDDDDDDDNNDEGDGKGNLQKTAKKKKTKEEKIGSNKLAISTTNKSSSSTLTVQSDSLATLLRQALRSNDDSKLEAVLRVTDARVARNSVLGLIARNCTNSFSKNDERVNRYYVNDNDDDDDDDGNNDGYELLGMLLTKITTRLARTPNRALTLGTWLRAVLSVMALAGTENAGGVSLNAALGDVWRPTASTSAAAVAALGRLVPLRNLLNERVGCLPELMRLDGRLALLDG